MPAVEAWTFLLLCAAFISQTDAAYAPVRLMNGSQPYEGRVEVLINGTWGTVCDEAWGDVDAAVVCSQLGYDPYEATAYSAAHFHRGHGPVYLSRLFCNGRESNILECPRGKPIGETGCTHREDAGVSCVKPVLEGVRLVNGSYPHEGRVELMVNGTWGTVCDNAWDVREAQVVCRHLGYDPLQATAYSNAYFHRGSGPIYLDNLYCNGRETNLLECPKSDPFGSHSCSHSRDAGVSCIKPVLQGLRLVDGSGPNNGRVELLVNGTWGTICWLLWGDSDAQVICRQLGYDPSGSKGFWTPKILAASSGPIYLSKMLCDGRENSILDCPSGHAFGQHDCSLGSLRKDAGVVCNGWPLSGCPEISLHDPVSGKLYTLPRTEVGRSVHSAETCPSNGLPFVSLKCELNEFNTAGHWSKFQPNTRCVFPDVVFSETSAALQKISQAKVDSGSVENLVNETLETLRGADNLQSTDIVYVSDFLTAATSLQNLPKATAENLLRTFDNIMAQEKDVLEKSISLGGTRKKLFKAFEKLGVAVDLQNSTVVRLVANSLALEVWNLSNVTDDVPEGLVLRGRNRMAIDELESEDLVSLFDSSNPDFQDFKAAVYFRGNFVRDALQGNTGENLRLVLGVAANPSLYKSGQLEALCQVVNKTVLNSFVVSASLYRNGKAVSGLQDDALTAVFEPLIKLPEETKQANTLCVSWDAFGAEGKGAWSQHGCHYNTTVSGRDVCVCSHLGSFATLMVGSPASGCQ